MVKHLGHEVKLAHDIRTAGKEPGYPVDCDMCSTELVVAEISETPVVCQKCWDLLEGKEIAEARGFDLGI
jgi:ribosomal protein S27E